MSNTKEQHETKIQATYLKQPCPNCNIKESELTLFWKNTQTTLCIDCYQEEYDAYFDTILFYVKTAILSIDLKPKIIEYKLANLCLHLRHCLLLPIEKEQEILAQFDKIAHFFKLNHYPELYPSEHKVVDLGMYFLTEDISSDPYNIIKNAIFELLTTEENTLKLSSEAKFFKLWFTSDYYKEYSP